MPIVIGAPRSGTTLLRFMLDAHPAIAIPPETGFLAATALFDCDISSAAALHRLITTFPPDAPAWDDHGVDADDLRRELEQLRPYDAGEGFRAFYRLYARRQDKPRYGDKTPMHTEHVALIERLLPEAHFVHIIRDGRDASLSLRRMWFAPAQDIPGLAAYWRRLVRAARSAGERANAYIEVAYEDLVRHPQRTLEAICKFIDLPFDSAMLRYWERTPRRLLEHRTRTRPDGSVIVTHERRLDQQRLTMQPLSLDRLYRWKTDLTDQEQAEFWSVAGDTLAACGYEPHGSAEAQGAEERKQRRTALSTDAPMRVLFTNVGIANRTGTEVVAMDLARGLASRGHRPMIWAPLVEPGLAAPLIRDGIPVVSRFEDLPDAPDVIHGHHHLETIAALRRFPGVPAIFVCHGGHWWHDEPPRHPRIRRYVAVDDFCAERLARIGWIAPDRIAVVRNTVDTEQYRPRPALPDRPRRALIFSHYAGEDTHVEPIREACQRAGIALDTVGSGVGNTVVAPERLLRDYDVVFAKARCAMEAMATGCAVVLCDTTGLGPMVSRANVEALGRWNFGFRVLERPIDPALIAGQLRAYDPGDAADVSAYIRATAGAVNGIERYLALYRAVCGEPLPEGEGIDWHPATSLLHLWDQEAVRLRLIDVPATVATRRHFACVVRLDNASPHVIATAAPWPSMLMYRWLDVRTGSLVVEHGFRTILQPPAWPGTQAVYPLRGIAPTQPGEYILRATIVQEGWRWLDAVAPAVYADAGMVVTPSSPDEI